MKKLLLIFFILPLGSCITNTENISISYNSSIESLEKPNAEIIEKKQTTVISNDDCYSSLKPLLDKGMPIKPDISAVTNIDETLLNSIKEHREYIKELTDKIKKCHH